MSETEAENAETWPQRPVLAWLQNVGEVFILLGSTLRELPSGARKIGLVVTQMEAVGVGSMPLTVVLRPSTDARSRPPRHKGSFGPRRRHPAAR